MSATDKPRDCANPLRQLMARVGVSSFRELSRRAGVSEWQVRQLRQGRIAQMRWHNLCQLSQALEVSPTELLVQLGELDATLSASTTPTSDPLRQEYDRLQAQLQAQPQQLRDSFERESLDRLESFLRFWYAAARVVRENPNFPAKNLLPLVRPVENLLEDWQVSVVAEVGDEVNFDPQQHQLKSGTANPGDTVRVTHRGYRHGDRLFLRAQVEPIS